MCDTGVAANGSSERIRCARYCIYQDERRASRAVCCECQCAFPDGTHRVTGSAGFVYEKNAFNFQLLKKAGAISIFRTLQKGETVKFALLGTVCSTRDFADPFGESVRQVVYANYEGTDRLLEAHQAAWDKLWKGM